MDNNGTKPIQNIHHAFIYLYLQLLSSPYVKHSLENVPKITELLPTRESNTVEWRVQTLSERQRVLSAVSHIMLQVIFEFHAKYSQELSSCSDARPFGCNRREPKSGGCCAPFRGRKAAGSTSNAMSPGLRPTSVGMASHWPCVTDSVVYIPTGSMV